MSSRQNENTIKLLKKELQKEVRKSPADMDNRRVIDILKQLSKLPMNKELLSTTKIGKVVNKLRKNPSMEEIGNLSANIVAKWKTIALKDMSSSNSSSRSASSASTKVEVPVYKDKAKYVPDSVDKDRIQIERSSNSKGPVIYWMSRYVFTDIPSSPFLYNHI